MRRLTLAALVVAGVIAAVVIATRPNHHCFNGPVDPATFAHALPHLCGKTH